MMEASLEVSPSTICVSCGSSRLTWRVKRQRDPGMSGSLRMLAWQCKDCGGSWDEPLSRGTGYAVPAADGVPAT
jgi:hypothetical protein